MEFLASTLILGASVVGAFHAQPPTIPSAPEAHYESRCAQLAPPIPVRAAHIIAARVRESRQVPENRSAKSPSLESMAKPLRQEQRAEDRAARLERMETPRRYRELQRTKGRHAKEALNALILDESN